MSICGHAEWCGPDPTVIRLDDNGVRKVQVTLEDSFGMHRFVLAVALRDPEKFIDDLEKAFAWAEEA